MNTAIIYLANLIAIVILVFGLYVPRHHRRDLMVAYLGVNIGVLAVASVLAGSTIGMGLGLGLFGILSIIRLRSDELAQHEVAYYFSALGLGLLGGLAITPVWLTASLMALIVGVMFVGDHPRLLSSYRRQLLVLDRAFLDEAALRTYLAQRLGATIHGLTVTKVDLVNDTTTVEVRFALRDRPSATMLHLANEANAFPEVGLERSAEITGGRG
ncbi:MAG: DUF4956 domain-containing protein [Thermoleophilia bacterium]